MFHWFAGQFPTDAVVYLLEAPLQRRVGPIYVGEAVNLRTRMTSHLVRADSSLVVSGNSPITVNPGRISRVSWWTDPSFGDTTDRPAAEQIAFDVLRPAVASRAPASTAVLLRAADPTYSAHVSALLRGTPTGQAHGVNVESLLQRVVALEHRCP